jgi:hypothetical protein
MKKPTSMNATASAETILLLSITVKLKESAPANPVPGLYANAPLLCKVRVPFSGRPNMLAEKLEEPGSVTPTSTPWDAGMSRLAFVATA